MPTHMQKKAVEALVGKGGTVSNAMREAGYSENTINTPAKLTESEGFIELMEVYLPDHKLLKALSDDIEGKPKNRKAELELAFKVKGRIRPDDKPAVVNFNFFDENTLRKIGSRAANGNPESAE